MGGQSLPEDKGAEIAEINRRAAEDARIAEAADLKRRQSIFDTSVSSAFDTALQSANDYFSGRGLDPSEYASPINNRLTQIRGSIPNLAEAPGSFFENAAQGIYDQETDNFRSSTGRTIDEFAPYGFARDRISNEADDATVAAILAEERQEAEEYARRLLDRGVVTTSGFDAMLEDLTGQEAGARSRLDELSLGELERGRGGLREIADTGRTRAANLDLGSAFDPYSINRELDAETARFFENLGGTIRGITPTNLFDTSGLAALAGSIQGGGNTAFDPRAVAGLPALEDEDEDEFFTNNAPVF